MRARPAKDDTYTQPTKGDTTFGSTSRRAFLAGLAGGLMGALLIATVPMVSAAVGDAIRLGQANTGDATTTVQGSSGATLQLVNQKAGAPALSLKVQGNSPPLKVDSGKKVARLNADKVDGRSANQIVRAAYQRSLDAPDSDGTLVVTTIYAPTAGFLVMAGSVAVDAGSGAMDAVQCRLAVHRAPATNYFGHRTVVVHNPGGGHTSQYHETCGTQSAIAVPAGTYEVSVDAVGRNSARFNYADVWVLFVPFDGTGAVPTGATW